MAWNGCPRKLGWGQSLEFRVTNKTDGTYSMDSYLGGVPCFVLWTETGGSALCNTEIAFNPNFAVLLKKTTNGYI